MATVFIELLPLIIGAAVLEAMRSWLERNNRVITLTVSSIFGAWFVWKGITKLLG
jgi:hypothetical protein